MIPQISLFTVSHLTPKWLGKFQAVPLFEKLLVDCNASCNKLSLRRNLNDYPSLLCTVMRQATNSVGYAQLESSSRSMKKLANTADKFSSKSLMIISGNVVLT